MTKRNLTERNANVVKGYMTKQEIEFYRLLNKITKNREQA